MIISKRPPYANTTADAEKTRGQIDKLLRAYGIDQFQWTQDRDIVTLTMKVETEIGGVKKVLGLKISPPTFASVHKTYNPRTGKNDKVYAPNWAQSYRLLYHWLKAKIESIAYGMFTTEQEFLSQIMVALPTGEQKTVGEILTDPARLAKFALEEKPSSVREAEYRVE